MTAGVALPSARPEFMPQWWSPALRQQAGRTRSTAPDPNKDETRGRVKIETSSMASARRTIIPIDRFAGIGSIHQLTTFRAAEGNTESAYSKGFAFSEIFQR
jgi:hypothetical protein